MWKSALAQVGNRAGKTLPRPAPHTLPKEVAAELRNSRVYSGNRTDTLFSPKADALCDSRTDYLTHLQSSSLYSSLSTLTPVVCTTDENDTLLRSAERLSFLHAQETFCALIKAGEAQSALQLTTFWKYRRPKRLRVARAKVRQELVRTIRALEELKDTSTMKALIEVISSSLKEQQLARKSSLQAVSLTHSDVCSPFIEYKLFEPLGSTATAHILVCAAEAACRLGDGEGMSVLEKLAILDKCAHVSATKAGTARLPYQLYRLLEAWTAERVLDTKLVGQVCPNLPSKLVHPSHYTTLDILSLSAKEARYIQRNWVSWGLFQPYSDKLSQLSTWSGMVNRLLASSKALQAVEAKCLLVALMCGPVTHATTLDSRAITAARKSIVRLLRSSQPGVRRHAAASLLKKRHLFAPLRISPPTTAYVYLQSFHSKSAVDPTLCKICAALFFRMCRAGQYVGAARVVWNHLSVECSATAGLFKRNTMAVELAAVAMSQAMREACAKKYGQSWMGYRSLALLRTAASTSQHVTVMHCVPVCVGALECGVPFAAVSEALSHIFSDDAAQKAWALNLVRLCSDAEMTPTQVKANRCGIATDVASYLAQACRVQGNKDGKATLQTPSRSKQLALWTTLTAPDSNPRLNALMTAVYLDGSARDSILECTWCHRQSQNTRVFSQKERATKTPLSDIWYWEVAAAMASNCSSVESLTSFLKCLNHRKPRGASCTGENADNVAALLCSELDADHCTSVVSLGQYHHFQSSAST
ncbi:hypothetical protein Q4I32_004259 [Leishmania shawi]|uniref:Uncharacterized protein n=1 Tax=Leishmania shawi TaxID=5680 RepID=A0AAW3BPZ0_9TRYP